MYVLHLHCSSGEADLLSAELWEEGTAGIREIDNGDGALTFVAAFATNCDRDRLLTKFYRFSPAWIHEPDTDWVQETKRAWPGRSVGARLFLAPPWCTDATPSGRKRVIHNPGLAFGTGDHPCTQLALEALEREMAPSLSVADIGTGSGILAIAALQLGARAAFALDLDQAVLQPARENFELNAFPANLAAGSADCLLSGSVDVAIANINATVLLSLANDLMRIVRPKGRLILTGFPASEAATVRQLFAAHETLERGGWSCLISAISPRA